MSDIEDAEAVAREHGDFMVMRLVEGDLFEALPGKAFLDGNGAIFHFGEAVYAMRLDDLRAVLGAED